VRFVLRIFTSIHNEGAKPASVQLYTSDYSNLRRAYAQHICLLPPSFPPTVLAKAGFSLKTIVEGGSGELDESIDALGAIVDADGNLIEINEIGMCIRDLIHKHCLQILCLRRLI